MYSVACLGTQLLAAVPSGGQVALIGLGRKCCSQNFVATSLIGKGLRGFVIRASLKNTKMHNIKYDMYVAKRLQLEST